MSVEGSSVLGRCDNEAEGRRRMPMVPGRGIAPLGRAERGDPWSEPVGPAQRVVADWRTDGMPGPLPLVAVTSNQ